MFNISCCGGFVSFYTHVFGGCEPNKGFEQLHCMSPHMSFLSMNKSKFSVEWFQHLTSFFHSWVNKNGFIWCIYLPLDVREMQNKQTTKNHSNENGLKQIAIWRLFDLNSFSFFPNKFNLLLRAIIRVFKSCRRKKRRKERLYNDDDTNDSSKRAKTTLFLSFFLFRKW